MPIWSMHARTHMGVTTRAGVMRCNSGNINRFACLYFDPALKDLSPDWILGHRMQLRKLATKMHSEKGFYAHPAVVVREFRKREAKHT